VWRFVEEFAAACGKQVDLISQDDMAALRDVVMSIIQSAR